MLSVKHLLAILFGTYIHCFEHLKLIVPIFSLEQNHLLITNNVILLPLHYTKPT